MESAVEINQSRARWPFISTGTSTPWVNPGTAKNTKKQQKNKQQKKQQKKTKQTKTKKTRPGVGEE